MKVKFDWTRAGYFNVYLLGGAVPFKMDANDLTKLLNKQPA